MNFGIGSMNKLLLLILIAQAHAISSMENTDQQSTDQLIFEAHQGNIDEVKNIIEKNPELLNTRGTFRPVPHQIAGQNTTALIQATLSNNEELIKWLVDKGSDLLVIQEGGNTPLFLALYNANLPLANYLFEETKKSAEIKDNKKQWKTYLASRIRKYRPIETHEFSDALTETCEKKYDDLAKKILAEKVSCVVLFFGMKYTNFETITQIDSEKDVTVKMELIQKAMSNRRTS